MITGADGPEYQPSADDINCKLRVEYTPVRSDGVRGPTVVANVPQAFLTVDPKLTAAVEKNIRAGNPFFFFFFFILIFLLLIQ